MALEDFVEPEVGIAIAATAIAFSPGVRNTIRRGAVYGLAGILRAGDALSGAAREVTSNVQQAAASGTDATEGAAPTPTAGRSRGKAASPGT